MAGCENHFQAINARQGFGQCLLPHQRRQGWAATSLSCLSMLHQTIPCDRQTFISKTPQQYPSYYYMYAFLLPLQVIHLKEGHRNRQNKLWPVPSPAQHLEQVKTSSMYAPHPHTERFTQPSSPYWTPSSPPKQTQVTTLHALQCPSSCIKSGLQMQDNPNPPGSMVPAVLIGSSVISI